MILPDKKYYDQYAYGSAYQYNRRILGDATGEMGPFSSEIGSWYQDKAYFIDAERPWFHRGGGDNWTMGVYSSEGNGNGMFYFYSYPGFPQRITYRIVLTI